MLAELNTSAVASPKTLALFVAWKFGDVNARGGNGFIPTHARTIPDICISHLAARAVFVVFRVPGSNYYNQCEGT